MADDKEPKIQEVASDEDSDDDEAPQLNKETGEVTADGKNRAEKKNRKHLLKLGFKPVSGFQRITVKKSKHVLFVIAKPEVFKSPFGDSYVCFGEAKVEDMSGMGSANALAQAAAQMAKDGANPANAAAKMPGIAEGDEEKTESTAGGADAAEPEEKDVELVMTQANVKKDAAVAMLKKHKNDVVEAIMAFQMS